jgi:hypothetical protein
MPHHIVFDDSIIIFKHGIFGSPKKLKLADAKMIPKQYYRMPTLP